ncbi:uncharacterized protein SOCEGT47_029220 [Sorangium cellulosum]|uniref:MalT-like TPR region domain-containing protein n=1 Tax=Sorangium cellulosum TaxID=56 RepID=A0A4P2PZT4_SORCE|nr:hypothetical protein [Sorangium cellulosum]AUX22419.1 uncharacterized protein SOCEGT47_029220 [Sorangium cellulosum]
MSYEESQRRIYDAEAALREGDLHRARVLYREAAELQRAFVNAQPAERVRTKSVFGASAATLFYKAGDLDEAEQLTQTLLTQTWLEQGASVKLRGLLKQIADDRASGAHGAIRQRLRMLGVLGPRPPRSPLFHDVRP